MKISNAAFEVTQDIYNLGGKIDKLHEKYDNRHISEQVYYKKLYVYACEATCLQQVVDKIKSKGYRFAKYEKAILLLESIHEDISDNLKIAEMNSVNFLDLKNYVILTHKYKDFVETEDINSVDLEV